jgi:inner membrane protein involved in colicin E2 resistance
LIFCFYFKDNGNREADQIKYLQAQIENMTQEHTQINVEITTTTDQYTEYQNQMKVCIIFITMNNSFFKMFSIFSNFVFKSINSNKKRGIKNRQGI